MRTVNPEKHAAKRRRILEAAASVFAQRGYDGATTAAICREGGIGSGTLFHYFPDKRSLMMALFMDDVAAHATFLRDLDRSDSRHALGRVIDQMAADLSSPLAAGILTAAMQLALRDAEFAMLIEEGDQRLRAVIADIVQSGQVAGHFDTGLDPARAARWIQGIIDAGYFMTDADGFDPALDRAELETIIARYLGVDLPHS